MGRIKKFEQDKDSTTMTASDDVDMEAIAERCEQLRTSIEATKSEYEKEKMQVRQAYHLVHLVHLALFSAVSTKLIRNAQYTAASCNRSAWPSSLLELQ